MTTILVNDALRALVATLPGDVLAASPTSVEFLFDDDLVLRIGARPNESHLVIEAFAGDAAKLRGAPLQSLIEMLLSLNALGLSGRRLAVGLDDNGFVVAFTRLAFSELSAADLPGHVDFVAAQTRAIRALIAAIIAAA